MNVDMILEDNSLHEDLFSTAPTVLLWIIWLLLSVVQNADGHTSCIAEPPFCIQSRVHLCSSVKDLYQISAYQFLLPLRHSSSLCNESVIHLLQNVATEVNV